ncbi:hypothetical protein [Paenibacillus dokdonensis]|uniref:hypothetical protein n=1 Tax=Paenibacillus dokdonensis TaxID=2567944 RepID=UPI0010A8FB3B|nr:hypothetical protein [Paenibacillus dokdonensis]
MTNHSRKPGLRSILRETTSEEKGAALILAMLTVVVMAILGLVLLDVLRGSMIQATASEASVQAEMLAQKGLDESVSAIRSVVVQSNKDPDKPYRERMEQLDNNLQSLLGSLDHNSDKVKALKGTYNIQIKESSTNWKNLNQYPIIVPDYPYSYRIVIQSTGIIPTRPERSVTKEMELYVSTVHPVFRYPVSSKGNLTLNGFSYIVGDIAVNNEIKTSDVASFIGIPGSSYTKQTNKPAIKGFIHVQGNSDSISADNFSVYTPFVDNSLDPDPGDIDVSGIVNNRVNASPDTGAAMSPSEDLFGRNITDSTIAGKTLFENEWVTLEGNVKIGNQDSTDRDNDLWIRDGTLNMIGDSNKPVSLTVHHGSLRVDFNDNDLVAADLAGTIMLDEGEYMAVSGNVTLNDGFKMTGNMYVRGDLKIIGSVDIDGAIYVDGGVELKNMASINQTSLNPGESYTRPLILMASGEFIFSDNQAGADQKIRAFFYSNQNLVLYGILSRQNVTGGVHGDNVMLSSVGINPDSLTDTEYNNSMNGEETVFNFTPNQSSLQPDQAGIQIYYDDNLYKDPPAGIATTNTARVFVNEVKYVRP